MSTKLQDSWLIAVWPGMGGIAQIAGSYLVRKLAAEPTAELAAAPYFDTRSIKIHDGLVGPRELPSCRFYGWKDPEGVRDLVIFIGEQQPPQAGYELCQEMLTVAAELGVSRAFTFAAMGSPIRPDETPRVFAVATKKEILQEVQEHGLAILAEGEISGLNGVLLSAAMERGIDGVCLLGEFPFFASSVPNPRASAAVLRGFASLAGLQFDLTELDTQAIQSEHFLMETYRGLEQAARQASGMIGEAGEQEAPGTDSREEEAQEGLDDESKATIEGLFAAASKDPNQAFKLKAQLDRLGLFKEYEDRFLDLFNQAD